MTSSTDLTAAADVLGRAADRLEEVTAAAIGNFERNADTPWWTPGGLLDAGHDPEDADFMGAVSPLAVAALVPLLRMVASRAAEGKGPIASSVRHYLDVFARRVLREEADGG